MSDHSRGPVGSETWALSQAVTASRLSPGCPLGDGSIMMTTLAVRRVSTGLSALEVLATGSDRLAVTAPLVLEGDSRLQAWLMSLI